MTTTTDKRKNIQNIYPLSPMQQGILFHTLLAPEAGAYVPQIVLTLTGDLNAAVLKQAWQQAVNQHDVLRTAFYWEQRDEPFQVVYRQAELAWVEQDWRAQDSKLHATRLQIFLDCHQTQPFNLQTPPLIRVALIRLGDRRYHLIWAYHHLILDGWSAANLLKTIFGQYLAMVGRSALFQVRHDESASLMASPSPHPPISPSSPYTTYLTWLQSQDPNAAKAFWQTYLKGFSEATSLPIFTPASTQADASSDSRTEQQRVWTAEQTAQLRTFAQQHQLTLNTLIQAAFSVLMSRYCDRDDVVFGATCAGRPPKLPGSDSMVGLFINTLPVRVQVPESAPVVPWLQQLQRDRSIPAPTSTNCTRKPMQWRELPAGQALFDCLLVVENYPVDASLLSGQAALTLDDVQFIEWTHFPLTLLVSVGERLTLTAKFSRNRVSEAAISRLLTHLEVLLMGLTTHAGPVQTLPLLTPKEEAQLVRWNQTAVDYPLDLCLPDWIEAQARKTPDAVALIFQDESLTYTDLNARANQLAHCLQGLGVGTEVSVAVCVERSPDMVIALLGILKAGGAYVPLDPSYPRDRLAWMLEDATPPVLITHAATDALQADLPSQPKRVNLTAIQPELLKYPITPPCHRLDPDNSIYILYTSGSTGRPKGVINTHRGLVNRLCWMQDAYGLTASDRVFQKTPLSFDVSGWELFWPLMTGASLVLAQPEGHKDSVYLANLIQRQRITTLHFVPAMLTAFLETPNIGDCTSLKRVICSGEALSTHLQTQFFQTFSSVELHNLYGPTEAAIDVTAWDCRKSQTPPDRPAPPTVPIGQPIANTQIYLLDSRDRPVPPGLPGEIYIGGVGVARGYLNRADLTAERFVPNSKFKIQNSKPSTLRPLPSTLYKTGDRARYHEDGTLEYLARIDHQVKLRGFRIELGEIEAVLVQHPSISQAVVLLREDVNPQLVAYVVVKAEGRRQKAEELGNREQGTGNREQNPIQNTLREEQSSIKFKIQNSLPHHSI
ncbi:MAG: amino acid adenylation domain-containing protein, partial [Cyanobacteria bacterium J06636_16]